MLSMHGKVTAVIINVSTHKHTVAPVLRLLTDGEKKRKFETENTRVKGLTLNTIVQK